MCLYQVFEFFNTHYYSCAHFDPNSCLVFFTITKRILLSLYYMNKTIKLICCQLYHVDTNLFLWNCV